MHFDESHLYNKKDLKPHKLPNNKWHREDDELLANCKDILDASKPIFEWNNTLSKSFKTYFHSDELYSLLLFSNILNLVGNKEDDKDIDAISGDNQSFLQFNKENRDSGIQFPANVLLKKSW